ncbi:MAG: hypothetical protein WBN65_10840 [Gammaproteobacteria bacterium]
MSKPLIIAGLAALLASAPVSAAESDSAASAFMKCARISSDGQRLLCYDRLATDLIELGLTARGGLPDVASPASPGKDGATAAPAPDPEAARPAATEATQQAAASGSGQFGVERMEDAPGTDVEKIQSRYVGEFTGWDGKTVFELENGQVWQQIGSGRMTYRVTNPMITIKRAFMGSYLLRVEGRNKSVRVKRIK